MLKSIISLTMLCLFLVSAVEVRGRLFSTLTCEVAQSASRNRAVLMAENREVVILE